MPIRLMLDMARKLEAGHSLGQRFGVHRQGTPAVAGGPENHDDLHRAGEPLAERVRGILPWTLPR